MRTSKFVATTLAASLAFSAMAITPASAFFFPPWKCWWCHPKVPKKPPVPTATDGISKAAPYVVGCVMGSAFSLIAAALAKKTGELTIEEAQALAFSCGLLYWRVAANFRR